jgi:hypothetical protein
MKKKSLPAALACAMPLSAHAAGRVIATGEARVSAQRNDGALRWSTVVTSADTPGSDKIEEKKVGINGIKVLSDGLPSMSTAATSAWSTRSYRSRSTTSMWSASWAR